MYVLVLALLCASPDDDARAALALAQAATLRPPISEVQAFFTYAEVCHFKGNLVTFLGCKPRRMFGTDVSVCTATTLPGFQGPAIIVSKDGIWLATLPANATDVKIREVVSRRATPFMPRLDPRSIPRRVDDSKVPPVGGE